MTTPVTARDTTPDSSPLPLRRLVALGAAAFVAVLLLEAGWMLVVGPYRAIDEGDHALRADAVAGGQWRVPADLQVAVRPSVAAAAQTVCESRRRGAVCVPTGVTDDGRVLIHSTAGAYNPLFYAVVGTAARPFEGYRALYAMRAATMVLDAAALAVGLMVAVAGFRTRWYAWSAMALLTPTTVYTAMVVAPNGLEAGCSFILWTCLLAQLAPDGPLRDRRVLPVTAGIAAAVLAVLRSFGPLWLVAIVGVVLLTSTRGARRARDADDPTGDGPRATWDAGSLLASRAWRAAAGVAVVACAAGAAWTVLAGTNRISIGAGAPSASSLAATLSQGSSTASGPLHPAAPSGIPQQVLLWILQTIGAVPYRDQPLPGACYLLVALVWAVCLVVGWRVADRRLRWAVVGVGVVCLVVPVLFTLLSYHQGWLWQGRYHWPVAMGVFLVAGAALDLRPPRPVRAARWLLRAAMAAMAGASVLGEHGVLGGERATSPLTGTSAWFDPPFAVTAAVTILGFAVLTLVLEGGPVRQDPRTTGSPSRAEAATH